MPAVNRFVVKSADGETKLEFSGEVARVDEPYAGVTFSVRLSGTSLSASVGVYDHRPRSWSAYFRDLAEHWRGWQGLKAHESLEGHLRIEASADALGHVRLTVHLRGTDIGAEWQAEDSLHLEAGQLEKLANEAQQYFG